MVSAYIDRELSEDDRSRVRRHIASCSECYAAYQSTLALKNALASMAPVECPPYLWEGVEARISAVPLESVREGFSLLRSAASFVKIVAPAAVVGALIAVPVVQLALGIDLIGPIGTRVAGIGANTVQTDEAPQLTLRSIAPAQAVTAVSVGAGNRSSGRTDLILGTLEEEFPSQLELDSESHLMGIGGYR